MYSACTHEGLADCIYICTSELTRKYSLETQNVNSSQSNSRILHVSEHLHLPIREVKAILYSFVVLVAVIDKLFIHSCLLNITTPSYQPSCDIILNFEWFNIKLQGYA